MTHKYYNLNFYKSYLEIEINFIPKDDFNKNKLFYDLILYYKLNDIIIKHKMMTVERIHPKAPVMLIAVMLIAIFTCLPSCINLSNIYMSHIACLFL